MPNHYDSAAVSAATQLPDRTAASIEASLERMVNELNETAHLVAQLGEATKMFRVPDGGSGKEDASNRPVAATSPLVRVIDDATGRSLSINETLRNLIRGIHL